MNKLNSILRSIITLGVMITLAQRAQAATTYLWTNSVVAANNWNANTNWTPNGSPGAGDTVTFGTNGCSSDSTIINNVVSADTTVGNLFYTNGTTVIPGFLYNVTQIPSGVTLTVTGNYTNGGIASMDGLRTATVFTGGGTLSMSGNNFVIGNNGSTTASFATNDLSTLTNFIYNASGGTMLIGWNLNRSAGVMILANGSNYITAGTITQGAGGSSNGGDSSLLLGPGTNVINVGTMNVIQQKANGSLRFAGSLGGLRLRGVGGTDTDRANMTVATRNATGTGTTTGSVLLNNHQIDMKLGTLTIGNETGGAAVNAIGNFTFNQGVVDATTVALAVSSGNAGASAIGNLNVLTNALLTVSGNISLANASSGTASNGVLNVNGGLVFCTNNIFKTTQTSSTGTVVVANSGQLGIFGKLGSPGAPVDYLNVTNGTIHLSVDASGAITTNAVVTTVNASGTTTLDIAQVIGVVGPTTIPLVSYSTLNGSVAGNFTVTYPVSTYSASLVDNSAQKRIDLSISPLVIVVPLVWSGATNGDWDTTTSNWLSSGAVATYSDFTNVVFDDTASNSVVNLTATLSPATMVMSNSVLNYTFAGTGTISGTNALTLKGSARTIFDMSGIVNYSGGTTIGSGTLQIGNSDANGNLPGASVVVDNGSLVYKRSDSVTNDNTIAGSGSLTQNGNGVLTLVGANNYGTTTISSGALQVGSGGASGTLGSGAVTDNSALILNRSGTVTVANVINGSGSVTNNCAGTLTLSGASGFGGGLTVNSGVARLSSTAAGTGTLTYNPGGTAVWGTVQPVHLTMAGGIFGVSATLGSLTNELTANAGTTSTVFEADPQNLAAADATELIFSNAWHGSGTIIIASVTNDTSADSGNGCRQRSVVASDFSGSVIMSNNVKFELQTTVTGPYSPIGTGTVMPRCGAFYGTNSQNEPTIGGYSELNLRANSSGDTTFGNNVALLGAGLAVLDPLGSAAVGSKITMGNLTIGGGQILGVYVSAQPSHNVVFPTVSLSGGMANFSPKTPGFGAISSASSDLTLGNISETASSGIIMSGMSNLFLVGSSANVYSLPTTNLSGTMVLSKTSGNAIPGPLAIPGGTVSLAASDQIADGSSLTISGGTLAMGGNNDTVGSVSLTGGGVITGPGILTASSDYDAQSGSASATLAGSVGLTKSSGGTVTLAGNNSYSGNTLISAGTLAFTGTGSISNSPIINVTAGAIVDVSGRTDGTLILPSGQTLKGDGTVNGSLLATAGSAVSPGNSIGVLTVTNAANLGGGTTTMEVDASLGTNDQIVAASFVYSGGSLVVNNLAGTLAAGQTYKLFSAPSYPVASFSSITLPSLDPLLVWHTNLTVDGTISVGLAGPTTNATITSVFLSDTNIIFGGTNNNGGQNFHYALLVSTNVTLPLSQWTSVSTNTFNPDGTFNSTNAIDPSQPQLFYDVKAVP